MEQKQVFIFRIIPQEGSSIAMILGNSYKTNDKARTNFTIQGIFFLSKQTRYRNETSFTP